MIEEIDMELQTPDILKLSWLENGIKITSFDDQAMLIVYCPELHRTDVFSGGVKCSDAQCTFKFNPKMAGKRLKIYDQFIKQEKIGNSRYLGSI
ncbi:hypothetical protein N824_04140 [Pedobacter sp. V48]|nr:hypothetical protein N824_04140 [Pedobacter sp. V48]